MGLRAKQLLVLLTAAVVAGVMVWLGLWQMASYQESTRDISAERAAEPPIELVEAVAPDGTVQDAYGRTVVARGRFLPQHHALVGTGYPLRVVTLFQLNDGRHVAVVRGSVGEQGNVAEPASGDITLTGVFLAPELGSTQPPAPDADVAAVRVQTLAQGWPQPVIAGYVTVPDEVAQQAGLQPAELQLPKAEGSPTHRGYALQWWVFAVAALAMGGYSARKMAAGS